MSKEYIKGQINAKEVEITRIEEEATNKIASSRRENEEKFDSGIEELQIKLGEEEQSRDEAIQKAGEWAQKKKEKIASAKEFSKKVSHLKSEKEHALNHTIKEIESTKKSQFKDVHGEIKTLNKDLANIEKEKAKAAA